jgi:hypothetical protein
MGLLLASAVLLGIVFVLASRMQASTLFAGRAIALADSEKLMPNGVQGGITPRWQPILIFACTLGLLSLLVLGSLQRWYAGIAAVLLALLTSLVAQRVLPGRLATYLRLVAISLANREADYRRAGDVLRAEAAHHFFLRISQLMEWAAANNVLVPTMREAKAAAFGQLDR